MEILIRPNGFVDRDVGIGFLELFNDFVITGIRVLPFTTFCRELALP